MKDRVRFISEPEAPTGPGSVFDALDAEFDAEVQRVVEIDVQIAGLEAERMRCLARVAGMADRRATLMGGDSQTRELERRSLAAEVGCATRRAERTVTRMIGDAEHLVNGFPATLQALSAGQLSSLHARHLISHAITLPPEARSSFESCVLPLATELTASRFDDRARRIRELAHPESMSERARHAHEERHVLFEPRLDGMATISHHLPAVDALAIDDLIDRIARSERSPEDARTHGQRRSDALVDIVLGRGARPAVSASVMVTVPAATIAGSDAPAELHGYGPIDADTARRIAATAPTFLRVLTHPHTGEPAMVTRHHGRAIADGFTGRERYSAAPALRTVLAAADETCRFPNCGRRASRCELDHTRDWALGGQTTPENLAHLCSRHHHLKHAGRWKVQPDPDHSRHLTWRSPGGKTYVTTPRL